MMIKIQVVPLYERKLIRHKKIQKKRIKVNAARAYITNSYMP